MVSISWKRLRCSVTRLIFSTKLVKANEKFTQEVFDVAKWLAHVFRKPLTADFSINMTSGQTSQISPLYLKASGLLTVHIS